MKIDEYTGLPEIPKGYFWRVHKTHRGSGFFRVSLLRKRNWVLGKDKVEEWTAATLNDLNKSEVLWLAKRVYYEWEKPRKANDESLLGDYPPKKLESM